MTSRPSAVLCRFARPPATNSRLARTLGLAALLIFLIPVVAEGRDCVRGAPGIGDEEGRPTNADYLVVHELAHQWFGDRVTLDRWRDIWLNEGFATYAEWLWLQHEGQLSPQQSFRAAYSLLPADDPFWTVEIGDPGPKRLLDLAIYVRGAMTLQALRNTVGDQRFWKIVRRWASRKSRNAVTTEAFISLSERVSGQELDQLFETWLFTPRKPMLPAAARGDSHAHGSHARGNARAEAWLESARTRLRHGRY